MAFVTEAENNNNLNLTTNTTWLKAEEGALIEESKTPKDLFLPATNKAGQAVCQMRYAEAKGNLVGIEFHEKETFTGLTVVLQDEETLHLYKINMFYGSSPSDGLLLSLPNVDMSKPVKVKAFLGEAKEGQKPKTVCIFQQEDTQSEPKKFVTVLRHFTKASPNGLPPIEKIQRDGKDSWDSSAKDKWLRAWLEEYIINQIPGPKEA